MSGVLGLVRTKYIASVFGASSVTDAYNAAFNLPDMISYFLVGGVASITLVNILSRYREAKDESGADLALSAVLNAMMIVLGAGIALAEILAPLYTAAFFPRLDVQTAALCTHLTRLLLPAQFFFFVGGVLGSRLLVRKIFLYQAITPLVYNIGIILGGVLLSRSLGIDSLAWGVLAGAFVGAAALNIFGAFRGGLRYTPVFNLRHPAFLEWLKLSLPLMIGVSLAMADKWILGYFATADRGGLTRLLNAKTLFNAPLTIIGAAAGAASLPFFTQLYAQKRFSDFDGAVSRAVSRLLAVGLLGTAWMCALSVPLLDIYRGGIYSRADAISTARYFAIFSVSLALWSAQGIYARAFYAARNTITPAVSGTVVTLVSVPVYALLFRHVGVAGLAIASDLGILTHTLALAVLLHRKRIVSLASLEYGELGRALVAALLSWIVAVNLVPRIPHPVGHVGDVVVILIATAAWASVCFMVLKLLGAKLLDQLRNRKAARLALTPSLRGLWHPHTRHTKRSGWLQAGARWT